MKKMISVLMVITILFAFAACSNSTDKETQKPSSQAQTASDTATKPENHENTVISGKTLVVYFSASGNTENAAQCIADAAHGDLFEIVPKDAYTDDDLNWREESSRVNYEHENESARDIELVSSAADSWDSYDTVFIGYPIWWGIAAWPVDTFVRANDFSGKTVIPFCTSTSSDLGESGRLLEQMAGTGNWLEGKRFQSSVSDSEVKAWVDELDFEWEN